MSYQLQQRPDHTVEINASFEPEEVEAERRRILMEYRRKVRIPGFRPGKAPLHLVQVRLGDAVNEELEEALSKRAWGDVLKNEERFEPISQFRVTEATIGDDGGFTLTGEVEVRPRWDLPPVEEITLPEVVIEISDADIDAELEKIRAEQGVWTPAEGPAEDGMLVEVDLKGEVIDGEGEDFSKEGVRFVLGHDATFPEIQEALTGATVGETRTAEREIPADDQDGGDAPKKIRYTMTVTSLKTKELPPVDDSLADALGFDTLDALKERIREVLAGEKRNERRNTYRRAILDRLEEGIDPNSVPDSLVKSVLRDELNNYAYAMAIQGQDPQSKDLDWQEISAKMEPDVRKKVLDELILEQLGEAWGIGVPEAEVETFIAAEAQRKGVPPAEHRANLEKEGRVESIRHAARIAAVVDEAIRRAGGEVD